MCNDIKFCPDCKDDNTGYQWCFRCNPTRFEKEFSKWTSGNTFINKFIREAQIKAQKHDDVLEWIPFDRITNINHLDSEALFKAIWLDGPIETWDNDKQQWNRNTYEIDENLDGYEVVLKNLNNSSKSNGDEGFLNEWKHHFSCDYDKEHSLIRLFGFTQHPINLNHMIVMDYANEGSLKNFLPRIVKFNWHTRLNLLNDIIAGLEKIHDNNLVHCNLHDGNILTKRARNNYNGLDLFQNFVHDLGSCQPFESVPSASSDNESIYGVLPFIAPEVLGGEPYTPASDIYSCSMIMWELTSGIPPFNGRTHDRRLMLSIYEGERPGIIQKTPRCYVELMKACWDPDPSERPTVTEISTIVQNWIYYTLKYYEEKRPLNIKHEIDRKLIKENIDQVVEEIDDEQSQNDTIEFWKADKGLAKEKVENHIHKQR